MRKTCAGTTPVKFQKRQKFIKNKVCEVAASQSFVTQNSQHLITFIKSKISDENFGNFFSSGSTSRTSGRRIPANRGFRWKISRCLGQRFPAKR